MKEFRHFQLALRADKTPYERPSPPRVKAFLAFDKGTRQLVDLCLLTKGPTMTEEERTSFLRRAAGAYALDDPGTPRITEYGIYQGLCYYAAEIPDGESLAEYTKRNGPLPPAAAMELVGKLIDTVIALRVDAHMFESARMESLHFVTNDLGGARPRLTDPGLARFQANGASEKLRMREILAVWHWLLCGSPGVSGVDLIRGMEACVPEHTAWVWRGLLFGTHHKSFALEDMKKAFSCEPAGAPPPRLRFQENLFSSLNLREFPYWRLNGRDTGQLLPAFTMEGESVVLNLLPPPRALRPRHLAAADMNAVRIRRDRHPHVLRVIDVRELDEALVVAEESLAHVPLSRVLAAKKAPFDLPWALGLLEQLASALKECAEAGLLVRDLPPCHILLVYPRIPSNMELAEGPPAGFLLKFRPHDTLDRLMRMPLRPEEGDAESADFALRNAFFDLAWLLLCGGNNAATPSVQTYMELLREIAEQSNEPPQIADFLNQLHGFTADETLVS